MRIKGVSVVGLQAALEDANRYLQGNLEFRVCEHASFESPWVNVRLKCRRGRLEDGTPAPGVTLYRDSGVKGGYRAVPNASWDAHGVFLSCLYKLYPEAKVRAGGMVRGGVKLDSAQDMEAHWRGAYSIINDDD